VENKGRKTFREYRPVHHPEDFILLAEVAGDALHPAEAVEVQDLAEAVEAVQDPVAATDRKRILFKTKGRPGNIPGLSMSTRENQIFFIY
jgi:hypothetical protein